LPHPALGRGDLLVFVYHCFDRIVIHGYLSGLSRPEQVVHFFRQIVGVPVVSKEILSERTTNYQNWVEAFARNHRVPIEWAEKGVRKEDYVLRWLRRMTRTNRYGVYFIFKSMEQGTTFRISVPKYATADPNYRILAHQRSRFTHYYFYIRDEVLGPMVMRVASFFPFQATYYLNGHSFIEQELNRAQVGFRKHDNAFRKSRLPLLRRPHDHHREVRTRRNPAPPTEPAKGNDQDRHVMIPVIANHRPLRHPFFLLACRPPHPSSHCFRQFAPAGIAIVSFRMHRGRSARFSDLHLGANQPHPSSRPGMIRLNRASNSP
jgi:hypothetical protein